MDNDVLKIREAYAKDACIYILCDDRNADILSQKEYNNIRKERDVTPMHLKYDVPQMYREYISTKKNSDFERFTRHIRDDARNRIKPIKKNY